MTTTTVAAAPGCYRPLPGRFPSSGPQRARILDLAATIGLTRPERHELALMVLGVQITSFDDLYQSGADRLIAALTGHLTHERIVTARTDPTRALPPLGDATGDEPLPPNPITAGQLRKAHRLCREHQYTRIERHHFASGVLHVPVITFRTLSIREAGLVLDAFTGIEAITWLLNHPLPIDYTP